MNSKCHFCGAESDSSIPGVRVGEKWICDSCIKTLSAVVMERITDDMVNVVMERIIDDTVTWGRITDNIVTVVKRELLADLQS